MRRERAQRATLPGAELTVTRIRSMHEESHGTPGCPLQSTMAHRDRVDPRLTGRRGWQNHERSPHGRAGARIQFGYAINDAKRATTAIFGFVTTEKMHASAARPFSFGLQHVRFHFSCFFFLLRDFFVSFRVSITAR